MYGKPHSTSFQALFVRNTRMKETLGYPSSINSSSRKPLTTGEGARLSIAVLGKSHFGKIW